LISKTEAKSKFLLTERDLSSLRSWKRPNKKHPGYSDVVLYIREQVRGGVGRFVYHLLRLAE
jgi:hypothetical protein